MPRASRLRHTSHAQEGKHRRLLMYPLLDGQGSTAGLSRNSRRLIIHPLTAEVWVCPRAGVPRLRLSPAGRAIMVGGARLAVRCGSL